MRKCAAAGHAPNLAMLIYRATPLTTSMPSPAGLYYYWMDESTEHYFQPDPLAIIHIASLSKSKMVKNKDKMCEHYNKTARELPSLLQNQRVYVQVCPQCNQWTPTTVTKTPAASQPRSYSVETTNGAHLVRNRRFIRLAQEIVPIPAESVKRDDGSSIERPKRPITLRP